MFGLELGFRGGSRYLPLWFYCSCPNSNPGHPYLSPKLSYRPWHASTVRFSLQVDKCLKRRRHRQPSPASLPRQSQNFTFLFRGSWDLATRGLNKVNIATIINYNSNVGATCRRGYRPLGGSRSLEEVPIRYLLNSIRSSSGDLLCRFSRDPG